MQSYFFFNDTATTEIYTLSLHDALPIFRGDGGGRALPRRPDLRLGPTGSGGDEHLRSGEKVRSGQAGGAYPSHKEAGRRILPEPEQLRLTAVAHAGLPARTTSSQIGRASCRERV